MSFIYYLCISLHYIILAEECSHLTTINTMNIIKTWICFKCNGFEFLIPNPVLHTVRSKYSTMLLSGLDFLMNFLSWSLQYEGSSYTEKETVWPLYVVSCFHLYRNQQHSLRVSPSQVQALT